ncbi:MAG: peptidoglycan D,D-transpeptidase FtsI family protein [Opitutales bacterium]
MSKAFVSRARSGLVVTAILVAFCVLFGRLFYLHVWEREDLLAYVNENRRMVRVLEARRGDIVDSRGNLMGATHTTVNLGVDPHATRPEDRHKLPELAELLGRPLPEIQAAFNARYRPGKSSDGQPVKWVYLEKGLDESTYDSVMALDIKGVYGNRKYERVYPGGTLAAHILGYVNKEADPVSGVERTFDYYLRGQDGWRETERDGRRRELARFRNREVAPSDGLNVELGIDQMAQHIVEREIQQLVERYHPNSVSVIVSEPATGRILALGNHPTFDPNAFFKTDLYPIENQRNRAITDLYEPGSTFKIVPAAAVLNEGIVRSGDVFPTKKERVRYKGRTLKLPSDYRDFEEPLSMREIVVKSSNRGAAHLGMKLGKSRLYDYAAAFGFGKKTGVSLNGEASGTLHEPRRWDKLTITRLPMGHAVSATPLQMHMAMSVVANRGVMMEPLLAKRVFDENGATVVDFKPRPERRVISAETAAQLASMLNEVVGENGTAKKAVIEGYKVAGKTGTTQKVVDGAYSSSRHVASFSGFFPADKPALAITVVVDDPEMPGIAGGGRVAAPVFRNIAEACIAYLGIRPSSPENESFFARER